jgi:hypothetical protein
VSVNTVVEVDAKLRVHILRDEDPGDGAALASARLQARSRRTHEVSGFEWAEVVVSEEQLVDATLAAGAALVASISGGR